jgi:hypothetical protein
MVWVAGAATHTPAEREKEIKEEKERKNVKKKKNIKTNKKQSSTEIRKEKDF